MTDTWDGRPENPEQSGMHLLRARLTGHLTGWYWNATTERFHHEHVTLGRAASIERYVYECPVLTPAEVAALVADARRDALEEAWGVVADWPVPENGATFHEIMVRDEAIMRAITDAAAIRALKERGDE